MNIASTVLVGFMLIDFMPALPVNDIQQDQTSYVQQGKGELTVTIQESQTVGSVPRGATRIPLLTVSASASCDSDVTLGSIAVTHTGQGRATDLSALYASDDFRRLGRSQSFDNRSGSTTLYFQKLTIAKCDAVRFQILADMSSTADTAGEHGVSILKPIDIVSTAKQVTLVQADASQRLITAPKEAGTITVNFLPVSKHPRYGRIETVARVQLSADAGNSHLLKRITFKNAGDARDVDLVNFTLQTRSGTVLTPVTHRMRGTSVSLDFDPSYILRRSQNIVLLLKAEIRASASKKISFYMEEPGDLQAKMYQER